MSNPSHVKTRFAPSPTGMLHAGNYRTAVFSYLFARQNKGSFIIRIEDTDKERSKKEYADNILESLAWLGLDYDEISHQSARASAHRTYLEKLIKEDKAYVSQEKIEKEGDRSEVIRFRNPGRKVKFTDIIRGEIEMDTSDLGDFVIAKSLDEPVFHLAVVCDDYDSGVTHVVRGEDHISNTPRQILIQEAIGATTPIYAHLPLLLSPDRTKLSKRKGALALTEYRDRGYLPEALLNYMAFLGWNPGTDQEIFSKEELIENFDLAKVQKGAAIFNEEKLAWFNKEYIKKMPREDALAKVKEYFPSDFPDFQENILEKIFPLIIERINCFSDITKMAEGGEWQYFFSRPAFDKTLLKSTEFLPDIIGLIENISAEDFTAENIKNAVWDFATEKGRGQVLWPMRVALTGREKSSDPFTVAEILGKEESLARLKNAIE